MIARILLVEDDAPLAQTVAEYLRSEGFVVTIAGTGPEGLRLAQSEAPDLVILDWLLPGMSGIDVCRRIRAAGRTPIIMLTARVEEADKLLGLELGADDYITKPFSLRELTARVRAVLRRSQPGTTADVLRLGPLEVDVGAHGVRLAGREVDLTPSEFKILAVLARHPGRVFTRLQLMEAALGEYYEGYERTVDSHISRLRQKIDPDHRLIQTVHGIGYKLVPPRG